MQQAEFSRTGLLRLQVADALKQYDLRSGSRFSVESETLMMYRAHGNALAAYARVFTEDADEADEVVQEAFLQYLLFRAQGSGMESPRRWLLSKVHEVLKERSLLDGTSTNAEVEAEAARCEGMLLDVARRKLPRWQKEIFQLRLLGLAYDEIGHHLGMQSRMVSRHLSLGIKRLRELIKREGLKRQ